MFIIQNKQLEKLIRKSPSLKAKLSDEQIETFIQRSFTLPPEGQEELIIQLQKEMQDYDEHQAALFQTAKDIAAWEVSLKKDLTAFNKQTRINAEAAETAKTEEELTKRLSELD